MTREVAILRDLKSERRVSMERYADELIISSQAPTEWQAKEYVLAETDVRDVKSTFAKIMRYKRRYHDYPKYVSGIDADIYHIADHAFAHLLRTLPQERTVVTCHDLMLMTQDDWRGQVRWSPALPLFRYSVSFLEKAAKVIAVSDRTRSDILRLGLADQTRIEVIPPPVSPVFSPERKSERFVTRARLGIGADDLALLHVGTPGVYKNVETVINVLVALRQSGSNAVLLRVGKNFSVELESHASRTGVNRYIHHLGSVNDTELAYIYGCSDVLLFPSLNEGFGWPVVEAMATGIPVVASDIDSITQSLQGTGIQARPMDVLALLEGIIRLSANPQLCSDMIERAGNRVRAFSRQSVGSAIHEVYESVRAAALDSKPK